jgi:4-hydroxy-2-oxoheptanedioate aldolase
MLDDGRAGGIIANADCPETVAHCIANARYQPDGIRSYGGQRFGLRPQPAAVRDIKPKVYVIIETAGATATLEQIAMLPGLAGLVLGPGDLALSLGLELRDAHTSATWHQIMDDILRTALRHGIEAWAWANDGVEAADWAAKGFHRVSVASDMAILRMALGTEYSRARGQSTV